MLLVILAVALAFYLAWNIGASDAGNYLSTVIGSKSIGLKKGILLGAIFGFAGAVLLSKPIIQTIGYGIIPAGQQTIIGSMAIVFVTGIILTAATYKGIPISTTQTIVGAILGYGIAKAAAINWATVAFIAISWIIAPLLALGAGFVIYFLIRRSVIARTKSLIHREALERKFAIAQIVSASLLVFVFAANDIASAIGLFSATFNINFLGLKVLASAAFALGILTFGLPIIFTMARRITTTEMTPARGFAAQIAGILVVLTFNQIAGMPLSTTAVAVCSIMGAGLVEGLGKLNRSVVTEVLTSWILTLPLAAIATFLFVQLPIF